MTTTFTAGVSRRVLVALTLVLCAEVLAAGHARGSPIPGNHPEAETFRVSLRADAADYCYGERAVIRVLVERDVGGVFVPAEAVEVAVAIKVRHRYIGGWATTNDQGEAIVRVRLPRRLPVGAADVTAFAAKDHPAEDGLAREVGWVLVERLFGVRRR